MRYPLLATVMAVLGSLAASPVHAQETPYGFNAAQPSELNPSTDPTGEYRRQRERLRAMGVNVPSNPRRGQGLGTDRLPGPIQPPGPGTQLGQVPQTHQGVKPGDRIGPGGLGVGR